jgi:hypothetical protein
VARHQILTAAVALAVVAAWQVANILSPEVRRGLPGSRRRVAGLLLLAAVVGLQCLPLTPDETRIGVGLGLLVAVGGVVLLLGRRGRG